MCCREECVLRTRVVEYEIIVKCVTKSAACPSMPSSSIDVPTLAAGVKMTVPLTNFKVTTNAVTQLVICTDPTNQRVNITPVKVTETTGADVKVDVGYQKDSTSQFAVANLASGTCYQLASVIAIRFGGKGDENAGRTDPFVEIMCLALTVFSSTKWLESA